jgi:hypothetical protein
MIWPGEIDRLGAIWVALAVVVGVVRKLGALKTVGLALLTAITTFLARQRFGALHRSRGYSPRRCVGVLTGGAAATLSES